MPTVNIVSSSNSQDIYGISSTYSTARATSTGSDSSGLIIVGQQKGSTNYQVWRGFLDFDTSSIPDDAIISSVSLTLTAYSRSVTSGTYDFDIQIIELNWGAVRETNYDDCLSASTSFLWRNTSGLSTDTQYESSSLTNSYINTSGNTRYALRSSNDKNGVCSSTSHVEYVQLYTYDAGTPSYKPILNITYSLPTQFFLFF